MLCTLRSQPSVQSNWLLCWVTTRGSRTSWEPLGFHSLDCIRKLCSPGGLQTRSRRVKNKFFFSSVDHEFTACWPLLLISLEKASKSQLLCTHHLSLVCFFKSRNSYLTSRTHKKNPNPFLRNVTGENTSMTCELVLLIYIFSFLSRNLNLSKDFLRRSLTNTIIFSWR